MLSVVHVYACCTKYNEEYHLLSMLNENICAHFLWWRALNSKYIIKIKPKEQSFPIFNQIKQLFV